MDAARDRAALAAVLGVEIPTVGSIDTPGLRLEIVGAGPGPARGRLQVAEVAPATPTALGAAQNAEVALRAAGEAAAGPTGRAPSTARVLALGWATVDLERAASTWPGARWQTAPRDSLVGARALVGRVSLPAGAASADAVPRKPHADGRLTDQGPADAITVALLEPDREGRLAASLARHGEGPTALYVLVAPVAIAGIVARLARLGLRLSAGTGPFGPAWAVAGPDPSSLIVIVVAEAGPDESNGRPRRGRRGTIEP